MESDPNQFFLLVADPNPGKNDLFVDFIVLKMLQACKMLLELENKNTRIASFFCWILYVFGSIEIVRIRRIRIRNTASQLRSDYQGRDEEGVSLQGGRIRGCSQLAVTHLD